MPAGLWDTARKANRCMDTSAETLNPYARFLGVRDPLTVLRETPVRLQGLTHAIGPAGVTVAPAPGKWTASEILCHLADVEIAFGFRLRQILAEDHHVIQPFDQERWAAPYSGIAAGEALSAFSALRHWNLLLIQQALPLQASRPVTHPERGTMTFQTVVETMAGHDLNHKAQLEQIAAKLRNASRPAG
jgi:hypothetical protein